LKIRFSRLQRAHGRVLLGVLAIDFEPAVGAANLAGGVFGLEDQHVVCALANDGQQAVRFDDSFALALDLDLGDAMAQAHF